MSDWELIRQYVDGKSDTAFASLVDRYMKMVYQICRRDLGDEHLADDATQIVFLLLARKAARFNRTVSMTSWLFQAARYVSRDLRKSEARRLRIERLAAEAAQSRSSAADDAEHRLNDGLARLGLSDREAIMLRYFRGLSTAQVAAEIGTTEAAARKRLSRALDRLRRYFAANEAPIATTALAALLTDAAGKWDVDHLHTPIRQALQGATPAGTAARASLLEKGLTLATMTTRQKLVSAALIVALGAGLTVSILKAEQGPTAVGTGVFADKSTQAGAQASSDRSEILADYARVVDSLGRGNTNVALNQAPNIHYALTEYGKTSSFDGTAVVAANQQPQKPAQPGHTLGWSALDGVLYPSQGDILTRYQTTLTVTSLVINGNAADAVTEANFTGTLGAAPYPTDTGLAAGQPVVVDFETHDHWIKSKGRWSITNEASQLIRFDVDGQPVS